MATRRRGRSEYRQAQLKARAAAGNLSAASVRSVQSELDKWADRITKELSGMPTGRRRSALAASRQAIMAASAELQSGLESIIREGREMSFRETQAIWQGATKEVLKMESRRAAGGSVNAALFGEVMSPNLTMMGMYETLGGASSTWRTRLAHNVLGASMDVDTIVKRALEKNVDPSTLAKALRPYIQGAEEWVAAAKAAGVDPERINDWRGLQDPRLKAAAKKLRHNTERIAFSEAHNARAEAEVQHFAADPLVYGIKWTLSSNRGKARVPDQCDALADNAWYEDLGFGRGEFPVDQVPLPPHPWDRCERVPLVRDISEINEPRPTGPRSLAVSKADIGKGLTADQKTRLDGQVQALLAETEKGPHRKGIQDLMGKVDARAKAPTPFNVGKAEQDARDFLDEWEKGLGGVGGGTPPRTKSGVSRKGPTARIVRSKRKAVRVEVEVQKKGPGFNWERVEAPAFKNYREAEDWARANGLAEFHVDLKGMTGKASQSFLSGVATVFKRYGISVDLLSNGHPRRYKGALGLYVHRFNGRRGPDGWRDSLSVQKSYASKAQTVAETSRRAFAYNKERNLESSRQYLKRVEDPEANGMRFRSDAARQAEIQKTRDRIESLENATRWSWSSVPDVDSLFSTAAHEAAHTLWYRGGQALRSEFKDALTELGVTKKDWYRVSEYGASKIEELWTETIAAIVNGYEDEVPEGIRQALQRALDKFVNSAPGT